MPISLPALSPPSSRPPPPPTPHPAHQRARISTSTLPRTSPPDAERIPDVPIAVMLTLHELGPTSVDVPSSCRKEWAHLLGFCLEDLNSRLRSGRSASTAPIAAAAAIVLAIPHTAETIHSRIAAINAGDWPAAFRLAQRDRVTRRPRGTHSGVARASALMERRAVRKAVAALQRQPVDDAPDRIAASIKLKLPPQRHAWHRILPPRSFTPSSIQGASARKWRDKVWAALSNTAACAAPGPSALRREHIEAAAQISSARIRERLADVIGAICAGMVPADDRFVTASVISPVPKKEPGDFRPIGVGEILRRIAARIGLSALLDHVGSTLHDSGQFGTSKDGGHHVYSVVRRCAAEGKYVVEVDLANAFCSIDRERVLRVVQDIPNIRPLIEGLYGNDSTMTLRSTGDVIIADRGVVQGCPLAAALFAMAIQPAIDKARMRLSTDGHSVTDVWYADDGTAASHSAAALDAYLRYLHDAMAERGLAFSENKSKFIAPASIDDDHVDIQLLMTHATRVPLIKCVGLPVCALGHPDADTLITHFFDDVVSAAVSVVSKIQLLEHPQHVAQALALAGSWSRLQYHVRGFAGVLPADSLERAEQADADALRTACGQHGSRLDTPQWLVAILPLREGGLGIHSVSVEAAIHAAHRPSIAHDAPGPSPPPPKQATIMDARTHAALAIKDILRKCWAPAKVAALMDASTSGARAWLSAPLNRMDSTLVTDRRIAATIVAHAIGCDILPAGFPCLYKGESCKLLRPPTCDPTGQHVTNCPFLFTKRHHAVRDAVFTEIVQHAPHATPMLEMGMLRDGEPYDPPNDKERVGDIVLFDHSRSSWMFVDIVVGGLARHLVSKAITKRGTYPNAKHMDKMKDPRRSAVLAAGQQHVILAFGPTGAPSYHSAKFLRVLARIIDPIQHRNLGTGKAAYTTARRLLVKCQMAILRTTAQRAVKLRDELGHTHPRHCDLTMSDELQTLSKGYSSAIGLEFNSLRHALARPTPDGNAHLASPRSDPGSEPSCDQGPVPSPDTRSDPGSDMRSDLGSDLPKSEVSPLASERSSTLPCIPHRRLSHNNNITALRGEEHMNEELMHSPAPPRRPTGASAGAAAAAAALAAAAPRASPEARDASGTPNTRPRPAGRSLSRPPRRKRPTGGSVDNPRVKTRSVSPPHDDLQSSSTTTADDARPTVQVKAHWRTHTDKHGETRPKFYEGYLRKARSLRRGDSERERPRTTPRTASPLQGLTHTPIGRRGRRSPRSEGQSSRSSTE
jgi:hypothetical protein